VPTPAGTHRGQHRCLEHDECRGVVEKALALQHGEQPARHPHGTRHGLDRHRVGRRRHRTERDGRGDPDPRHQRGDRARHRGHRRHHERDGEEGDAAPPGPEQRPRGALGRREQQRGQEQREDQLRLEVEAVGKARHERHPDAQQQHQRRPWQPQPVTHTDEQHRGQHQPDDEDEGFHGASVSGAANAITAGQAASASGP
jgi:hypothetical protein